MRSNDVQLTCHIASLEYLQVSLQRAGLDDGFVASFIIPICGVEYDVVSDSGVFQPYSS